MLTSRTRIESTYRSRSQSLRSPIEIFMRIPIRIPIHSLSESAIQNSTPIPLQILVHITIETPIEMIHQVLQPLFKALCRCLSKSRSEYIVYIDVYVYMYRLKQASPYPIGPKKHQNRTTVQLTLIEQVMKKWTKTYPKMVQKWTKHCSKSTPNGSQVAFGASRKKYVSPWCVLGGSWRPLGASRDTLGASWARPGPSRSTSWRPWRPS